AAGAALSAAGAAGAARRGRQKARGAGGNTMQTAMHKLWQRWRRGAGVAAWSLSMAAVDDGSVTHEAPAGRGPGQGFLADTGSADRRAPPVWPWTAEPEAALTFPEKNNWGFVSGLPIDDQWSLDVPF